MSGTTKVKNAPGIYLYRLADGRKRYAGVATVLGRQKWSRGHATIAEAKEARDALRQSLRTGTAVKPTGRLTLADYLRTHWLPSLEGNIKPGTMRTYRIDVDRISAHIGDVRLSQLAPLHLEALKRGLRQRLMQSTQNHTFIRLSQALDRAVRWRMLANNPCSQVDRPRLGHYDPRILSTDEIGRLIAVADASRDGMLIYLALATGMRESELFALRWSDVDVASTLLRIPASKTRSGVRAVALGPITLERLQQHRLEQMRRFAELDSPLPDLVFVTLDGTKMHQTTFWARWSVIRSDAGLAGMRFHDLRHVSSTLGARAGVHPKVMASRLGHANVKTTLEIYTHIRADDQAPAAAAIEALMAST